MARKCYKATFLIVIVAVAVAIGWNLNQTNKKKLLSELALANIEALAKNEVSANCGGMAPVLCKAICTKCATTYTTSSPGPATNVQGSCSVCGGSVKAYSK